MTPILVRAKKSARSSTLGALTCPSHTTVRSVKRYRAMFGVSLSLRDEASIFGGCASILFLRDSRGVTLNTYSEHNLSLNCASFVSYKPSVPLLASRSEGLCKSGHKTEPNEIDMLYERHIPPTSLNEVKRENELQN